MFDGHFLSSTNGKLAFQADIFAGAANIDIDLAGFDHQVEVAVKKGHQIHRHIELDVLFFARLQAEADKTLQFFYRAGQAANFILQIKLHHFITGHFT